MSAALLAEFDSFYQSPQKNQSNETTASNDLSLLGVITEAERGANFSKWQTPATKQNIDNGELAGYLPDTNTQPTESTQDDTRGSFERGSQQIQASVQHTPKPNYGGFTRDIQGNLDKRRPVIVRGPTTDESTRYISKITVPKQAPPAAQPMHAKSLHGELLFDAADELAGADDDDNDEFGDFETGTSETVSQNFAEVQSLTDAFSATSLNSKTAKAGADPLSPSSKVTEADLTYPHAPNFAAFQGKASFEELGIATKRISTATKIGGTNSTLPSTAWPTFEPKLLKPESDVYSLAPIKADGNWCDFADLPPKSPAVHDTRPAPDIQADGWVWDAVDKISGPVPASPAAGVDSAPPTNVPPPSVLLTLFPHIFDLSQATLFKAIAKQPFSLKNRIMSDPSTIEFLRSYLLIATVAARIIAGRKLRWKRDNFLSQAMKIGPAAAGSKGGMKLIGIDKAEIAREDREAVDVMRIWKEQLGRLKSAIAIANSSMPNVSAHLAIPDINDSMYVKTQEGALTAPKPCTICGLKREERINRVDLQVEDSFGEWWVEHWGHRACRNFWLEHESKLKNP
jgi:hypothetical protein